MSVLRNKVAQVLALFFLCTYPRQWRTFFTDFVAVLQAPGSTSAFNPLASLLFFHTLIEISGEVADQLLKAARSFTPGRHERDVKVRDAIRDGDAAIMNDTVLAVVVDATEKLRLARAEGNANSIYDEVVDWGLRAFASYAR